MSEEDIQRVRLTNQSNALRVAVVTKHGESGLYWRRVKTFSNYDVAKAQTKSLPYPYLIVPEQATDADDEMVRWLPFACIVERSYQGQLCFEPVQTECSSSRATLEIMRAVSGKEMASILRGDSFGIAVKTDPLALVYQYWEAVINRCIQIIKANDLKAGLPVCEEI